ncbi:hypothetical protein [Shewanella colwelliana]|uniref:hypothetical protein n=1 Tax=Shewanella colwelliana TaxID=23 RepID=UPI00373646A0
MTFTKKLIFVLASSLLIISTAEARDPNKKWTLEEAAKSHQENVGERASKKTDHKKYWDLWYSINRVPDSLELGGSGSELEEVWKGSAASIPVTWGQGDYYVEISFGHNNQGGSAWLTIDNSSIKKNVAIPSPFNYEGNYHITYGSGAIATYQTKTSGTPKITRISKFPTPQLNDCNAGQTEYQLLYCTGSGQMTCEEGRRSRTCATNGGWMPWQTIKQPSCITGTQQCR